MRIAIIGLGKMGSQIARKLHEGGHSVIVNDRNIEMINEIKSVGMIDVYNKEAVIDSFGSDHCILWLMIPSKFIDKEIETWIELAPKGSIIIDGGNSDFRLTKKRSEKIKDAGLIMLDVGTSGGLWGYKNGFALMIGGDNRAYHQLEPIFKTLTLPEGAYHYFCDSGSGHYVKMVHNAIEYGMMQAIAEGYQMLKEGVYPFIDLGAAGELWQHHSVITSWLNELSCDILKNNPELIGIDGYVAESGETRWALEVAKDLGIKIPAIQAAFDVRIASQKGNLSFATKLLSAIRNRFGGHRINK